MHFPTDKYPCSNSRKPKPSEDTDRRIVGLVQECNIQPKSLDKELTDEKLSDIAYKVDFDWRRSARKLDVSSTDINDIEVDHRGVKKQRLKALQRWKQMRSFKATGKAFVEVLLSIDELEQAKKVCLLLK